MISLSHCLAQSLSLTSVVPQADYLQPKLLGILAFFNMQLLSSSTGEKEKKKMVSSRDSSGQDRCLGQNVYLSVFSPALSLQALNSLMALMKLLGSKHISSVRVKMMTTLRTGLRYKEDFPQLCCRSVAAHRLHTLCLHREQQKSLS